SQENLVRGRVGRGFPAHAEASVGDLLDLHPQRTAHGGYGGSARRRSLLLGENRGGPVSLPSVACVRSGGVRRLVARRGPAVVTGATADQQQNPEQAELALLGSRASGPS